MTSETRDPTTYPDGTTASMGLRLPPDSLVTAAAERLVDEAKSTGVTLTGEGGLLTDFVRRVLQGALGVEMTDHIGYEPHAVEGRGPGNYQNGDYPRTVRTEIGDVQVQVRAWCERRRTGQGD